MTGPSPSYWIQRNFKRRLVDGGSEIFSRAVEHQLLFSPVTVSYTHLDVYKRQIVSQVQKENILVTALQAGTIDRAGTYTLVLSAKQQGTLSGYEISQTSLVPQTIQVLVDRLKEQSFEITDNIQYKTDPEYFAGTTKFTPEKITVSGPESIVNKIDKVQADYTISETLTSSQSLTVPIVLYDAKGNQLSTEEMCIRDSIMERNRLFTKENIIQYRMI